MKAPSKLRTRINKLAERYPPSDKTTIYQHMSRINRMLSFYQEKAPNAPEHQGMLFNGFINALLYAAKIITEHRKLTKKLQRLAEGENDDKKNN